ncbi:MAG: hypothetical protein B6247_24820 [Candidatus Parabeggiatoa sp. nov. 2]|nr:MAG: hypothetical protein B6247_24820 [Beggiatoa sp. 4572_84]
MLIKIKLIAFIAISSFLLSSCVSNLKPGATTGGVLGALTGGTACAKFVDGESKWLAVAGCALVAGGFGFWLGSKWDKKDEKEAIRILNNSNDGDAMSWTNPDNNNKFKMTLLETSTNSDGQKCRQFELVTNENPSENGKACRNKNGHWKFS